MSLCMQPFYIQLADMTWDLQDIQTLCSGTGNVTPKTVLEACFMNQNLSQRTKKLNYPELLFDNQCCAMASTRIC